MALRQEGDDRAELEQRVERLENTLRAVACESNVETIRGPCQHCEACLVVQTDRGLYCPNCGSGGPI